MAVYNGAAHLAQAIESVLHQTFADFELIIINDGSTDESSEILAEFAQQDNRIRIVNQENAGLTISLNRAWELANTEFIARMDADDICLPQRFAQQMAFLETQPTIAACGTWVQTINEQGRAGAVWQYPTAPHDVHFELLFRNVIAHPTIMLRKNVFDAAGLRYDPAYQRAQDYDLWLRATDTLQLANMPEVLLQYRVSHAQISQQHQSAQQSASAQIYIRRLQQIGLSPSPDELTLHQHLFTGNLPKDQDFLQLIGAWLAKIEQANRQTRLYPPSDFELFLAKKWLHLCRKCAPMGISAWHSFRSSPLQRHIAHIQQFKFLARCIRRH
jgi:glycosyltransferase involved in cell wall biosynthesis